MSCRYRKALLLALSVLLIIGTGCGGTKWTREEPALQELEEYTIESVYRIAKTHAQEWQADAYLASVVILFSKGNITDRADRISYEFDTPLQGNRQGYAWVDVYPREGKVHLDGGPIAETERPTPPLAFESAVVNSSQALQAAEAAGGRALRESHPGTSVTIAGSWFGDEEMEWEVYYHKSGPGLPDLRFAVHAQTGEVLDPRPPKGAWIRCSTDPSLNQGAYILWEAPGLSQDSVGSLPPCTMVEVIQWVWSGVDQEFWVLVTARLVRGWIAKDLLDFERP